MLRSHWIGWAAVFLVALAGRAFYAYELSHSPFGQVPIVDEVTYVDQARRMAVQGDWSGGDRAFWQPPLYPYVLGLVWKVFGERYGVLRGWSLLLGALSAVLAAYLGERVFGKTVGWLAGFGMALYGPLIYFEGALLPTALGTFFILLGLLAFYWAYKAPHRWTRWLLCGILLGLSSLALANLLLWIPALLLWIGFRRNIGKTRVQAALLLGGGALMAILPVTVRNLMVGHGGVLISANGGINFYVGNSADYDRTVGIRPGTEWGELIMEPVLAGHQTLSARSRFYVHKAWEDIRAHPLRHVLLMMRKVYLFWHGTEIKRNQDLYFFRRFSTLLRATTWPGPVRFPFGVVGPLALFGMGIVLGRKREEKGLLLTLFVGVYMVSVVLFFVTARYRAPVVPILLLFAAYGGIELTGRRHSGTVWLQVLQWAGLGVLFVFSNLHLGWEMRNNAADSYYNLAYVYAQQGKTAQAMEQAKQAISIDPNYVEPRDLLGTLYLQQGNLIAAIREYRIALRINPRLPSVLRSLGVALEKKGAREEAVRVLLQAIHLKPDLEGAYRQLGYTYIQMGHYEEAVRAYEEALRRSPNAPALLEWLGMAYRKGWHLEEALQIYRKLVRQNPRDARAWNNIGVIHTERGEWDEAIRAFAAAVQGDPRYWDARYNLAKAYEEQRAYDAAIRELQYLWNAYPGYRGGIIQRELEELSQRSERRGQP